MHQPALPFAASHPALLCGMALALTMGVMQATASASALAPALPEVQHINPSQILPPVPRYHDPAQQRATHLTAAQAIDPDQLNAAALQSQSSNNPAQERALQKLRATASASASAASRHFGEATPREAAWLLGLLALHGRVMPEDKAEARRWFERAQLLGHPLAAAGLAWCLMDGCTGPPNPIAARAWIARLRSADPGRALYLEWRIESALAPLDVAVAVAEEPNLQPSTTKTQRRQLLVRAARLGNAQALNELGLESVSVHRLTEALTQFRAAAAAHSPTAAANARLLASRLQVSTQTLQPQQSANQRFAQALRYHRGDGVPANYTEALRLYQVAAATGSKPAQQMLERIYSRPSADGAVDIGWMQQLANLDITREGAVLSTLQAPSAQLFVRDPTPLYDLIPPQWR